MAIVAIWVGDEVTIRPGEPLTSRVASALRKDIRSGHYDPGEALPSERELRERFGVSGGTIRGALAMLRAEGLVTSHQGRGVFVTEQATLRRLSTDITEAAGFYSMLDRMGKQPATVTEVTRGPASEEVADALGVPVGEEVVIRARILRTEGDPPTGQAISYFPTWVVEAAPKLADPNVSGLPVWLREAFGPTYSEDLVDARMPTAEERERLEIPEGTPVLIIKGTTRDQQHRTLHFIDKVTPAGRMQYGYKFGTVPSET
jgi:GntR family transcriptional regulator